MPRHRDARPPYGATLVAICCGLLAAVALGEPALLDRPVGASTGGVKLSTRLASLERAGLATPLLDRRVDPNLELAPAGAGTLGESLKTALTPHPLEASELEGVVYVGPASAARNLRTLAELGRRNAPRLDAQTRSAMRRVDSLSWPRLTEPRRLIESLLAGHGLQIKNPDQIPFDMWDEGRLPPMSLSDRLTLLLIGFDLAWSPSDLPGIVEFQSVPRAPVLKKQYALTGRASWDERAFREAFPGAEIAERGGRLELTGRAEAHECLTRMLRGESRQRSDAPPLADVSSQRITLTVRQQPALAVLEKLAQTFGLSIHYRAETREAAHQALSGRVDVTVSQATLEELLDQLGASTGCEISLDGATVEVGLTDS